MAMEGLMAAASLMAAQEAQKAQKQQTAYRNQVLENRRAEQDRAREIEERRRKEQLRQAVAAKRARMASAGFDSSSGSAAALIKGMKKRVEDQIREERNLLDLKRENRYFADYGAPKPGNGAGGLMQALQSGMQAVSLFGETQQGK